MPVQMQHSARAHVLSAKLIVPEAQALVPLPKYCPLAAVFVDDDKRVLVPRAFLDQDRGGVDILRPKALERESAQVVRSDLADVFALQSHPGYKRHCGGHLPARQFLVVQDAGLRVKARVLRYHAEMIDRIQSEADHVKGFISGERNVEGICRTSEPLYFHRCR